jgi:hypothetical protein
MPGLHYLLCIVDGGDLPSGAYGDGSASTGVGNSITLYLSLSMLYHRILVLHHPLPRWQ